MVNLILINKTPLMKKLNILMIVVTLLSLGAWSQRSNWICVLVWKYRIQGEYLYSTWIILKNSVYAGQSDSEKEYRKNQLNYEEKAGEKKLLIL